MRRSFAASLGTTCPHQIARGWNARALSAASRATLVDSGRPEGLQFTAAGCRLPLGGWADTTRPADLESAGRLHASMGACRSRTHADDRLSRTSFGRVEGGDGA